MGHNVLDKVSLGDSVDISIVRRDLIGNNTTPQN